MEAVGNSCLKGSPAGIPQDASSQKQFVLKPEQNTQNIQEKPHFLLQIPAQGLTSMWDGK